VRNRDPSTAGSAASEDDPSHHEPPQGPRSDAGVPGVDRDVDSEDSGASGPDLTGGTPTGPDVSSSFVVEERSPPLADRVHPKGGEAAAGDDDADSDQLEDEDPDEDD